MKRVISGLALALAILSAGPAMAIGFVGVDCDNPQTKEQILKDMKSMGIDHGYNIASYGVSFEGIAKAATITASKTKLICRLSVRVRHDGTTENIRGVFTVTAFKGGHYTASWAPGR